MKKALSVFMLSLILSTSLFAKEYKKSEIKECEPKEDGLLVLCDLDNLPITGIVKNFYENDELQTETFYQNGLKEGIQKSYYKDGNVWIVSVYQNGLKEGIEKYYRPNGVVYGETPYQNGKKEGVQRWYFENGSVKCETLYKNNVGHRTCYDENGNETERFTVTPKLSEQ